MQSLVSVLAGRLGALSSSLVFTSVLLGMLGLARAGTGDGSSWWIFGFGVGLAILAKGPVALLHLLLPAALGPAWSAAARARPAAWYLRLGGGFLLGAAIALAWVVPAAISGGEEYTRMILWNQTAGRLASSFAHQRPIWWYLPLLPLMWLPWMLWRPALA